MERILFRYVCPECKAVNGQVESVGDDSRVAPILPVIIFECDKCMCSYQVQFQMEDAHDDDPRAMEETEAILKSGKSGSISSKLTRKEDENIDKGNKISEVIRKKSTYVLLYAFQEYEKMGKTGKLNVPSQGKYLLDECEDATNQKVDIPSIKCEVASELVRRYCSLLIDVKSKIEFINEMIEGNVN